MRIRDTVKLLIAKYKSSDPFEIAKLRNILIFNWSLGNIFGYYTTRRRVQMIYLNTDIRDDYLRRFVCAHELGHAILHPKVNTPFMRQNSLFSVSKIEHEANEFAVELTIPDEALYEYQGSCLTVQEVATTYGVPQELAHLKKIDTYNRTFISY
jgi:Zn-dependent peptidase ImmA (M78 family)